MAASAKSVDLYYIRNQMREVLNDKLLGFRDQVIPTRRYWWISLFTIVSITMWFLAFSSMLLFYPLLMCGVWYYYTFQVSPVKMYYRANSNIVSILLRCPSLFENYYPTPFLLGGHLQTVIPERIRQPIKSQRFHREYVVNREDGGQFAIDYLEDLWVNDESPIVLVLCGLTGSTESGYARHLIHYLGQHHYRTDDIKIAVNHLHKRYPNAQLFAATYSIGANLITKYLGEAGHSTPLKAAVCISSPYDLSLSKSVVEDWLILRTYNKVLSKASLEYVRNNMTVLQNDRRLDMEKLFKVDRMRQFDEEFTIKLFNFNSIADYYSRASSRPYIPFICVPTLFISADNDPLVHKRVHPVHEVQQSPCTVLVTTKTGGHIGWPTGLLWTDKYSWTDRVCREFFDAIRK